MCQTYNVLREKGKIVSLAVGRLTKGARSWLVQILGPQLSIFPIFIVNFDRTVSGWNDSIKVAIVRSRSDIFKIMHPNIIDNSKYKFYYQSRAPNSNADQLMLTCNFLNVVWNGLIEHWANISAYSLRSSLKCGITQWFIFQKWLSGKIYGSWKWIMITESIRSLRPKVFSLRLTIKMKYYGERKRFSDWVHKTLMVIFDFLTFL